MNGGEVDTENTRVIEPSFGMNFQCIGMYCLQKTKPQLFIMKLKEGIILLDAENGQMFKLNMKKSNGSMFADILRVVPASS